MKSIRRGLTIPLLIGLAILWVVSGFGIYLSVRHSLVKSLDAEIAVDSSLIRAVTKIENEEPRNPGKRRVQGPPPAYETPEGGAFYQFWDRTGKMREKSGSLGTADFPFPGSNAAPDPFFSFVDLSDGRPVRMMVIRGAQGGKDKGKGKKNRAGTHSVLVIARETTELHRILRSVLIGIVAIGVGVSFGAIILVRIVVLRGLRPLRDLGDQTREIDTENLSSRFTSKGTPEELVPIYDHLNDLIDRLEAGFDRERRFSSDLAHEMRTPVAELKMLHEVALKWPERAGEGTNRESLEIANQLETIIETLLALARCESGEVSVKEEPVNLADVVESSWDAYADRAKERSLNARFDFPEVPVVKKSDEALLRRVFDNLFSNAVDYAPEGDSIEVSVRNDGVTVSNEAPTFDPGDLPHLFDRHWRSDPARSESHHAGLGLSLARACAEALGLRLGAMWEGGRISFALQT